MAQTKKLEVEVEILSEIKLGPYDHLPRRPSSVPIPPADDDKRVKTRHVVAFLGFWGFVVSFMVRININLAIVDMVVSNQSDGIGPKTARSEQHYFRVSPQSYL